MAFTGRPQTFLDSTLSNDGFFPILSLGDFQKIYRVPADRAQEAVEHQLKVARNLVNDTLVAEKAAWELDGYATLAAVDLGENSDLVSYYLDAVYLKAKAELLHDFQTFTRRDQADDIAKDGDGTYQALLANSNRAVRRLKGITTNITAELL